MAKEKRIIICATGQTIEEFQKVLGYEKFIPTLKRINKTPKDIIDEFLEIVEYYPSVQFLSPIIKDNPSDDKFLACALSAGTQFIVSGDHHLIDLEEFQGIPILTPAQFIARMKKEKVVNVTGDSNGVKGSQTKKALNESLEKGLGGRSM